MKLLVLLALLFVFAVPSPGHANQNALVHAFSGIWYSFEPRQGEGGLCQIELRIQATGQPQNHPLVTTQCRAPISQAKTWRVEDGKIHLFGAQGETALASLGGNQFRLSGTTSAAQSDYIFERASGHARSQALARAIQTYRCLYRGYASTCASPKDTRAPKTGGPLRATLLVALNARKQPRPDAAILGTLAPGTSLALETCLTTTDGLWCKARFGQDIGWVPRSVLRQERWPVLTYILEP